jgi:hypothetical protein
VAIEPLTGHSMKIALRDSIADTIRWCVPGVTVLMSMKSRRCTSPLSIPSAPR